MKSIDQMSLDEMREEMEGLAKVIAVAADPHCKLSNAEWEARIKEAFAYAEQQNYRPVELSRPLRRTLNPPSYRKLGWALLACALVSGLIYWRLK